MEFLWLKWAHILSAFLLFGTGLGSAFYRWMADRSGDLRVMAHTNRMVVLADWLFTTPTVIIQPITGILLAQKMGLPLTQGWILLALLLYALAGLCWLPVVWLQLRLRDLCDQALASGTQLDPLYWHYARIWFWLGVPAFVAMLIVILLMVFKPIL